MENTISFTQHVLKKDLETYSRALFKQVQELQIQNELLLAKIEHLEMLLTNSKDIPIIGKKEN